MREKPSSHEESHDNKLLNVSAPLPNKDVPISVAMFEPDKLFNNLSIAQRDSIINYIITNPETQDLILNNIITNPEVKKLFIKKAKFWSTIRSFLLDKEFLEVETPVLETSAGGAAATPFKTHHNALDMDVFLRISMGELWQKKLMVAGYDKTFEIGRQFRNEGMDMEHLQDYTQMEFYWAYANYEDGMKLVEEMYKKVAKEVLGKLKFDTHGYKVDLGKKWEIYDYEKLIKKINTEDYFISLLKGMGF